jgi:neutral ceramidase
MVRAGYAEREITPPLGTRLQGYAGRPGSAVGVLSPLFCRAMSVEAGGARAVIAALDVIGLEFDTVTAIRGSLAGEGVPPEHVILSCTHTHAGPATQHLRGTGEQEPEYVRWLQGEVVAAVRSALVDLAPAALSLGAATCDVAVNRRQHRASGIGLGENAGGAVDHRVRVARLEREAAPPITLLHYACHPVHLTSENVMVSAEYCGIAVDLIAEATGGHALFLQGCAGNINPRRREGQDGLTLSGQELAEAVLRAGLHPSNGDPIRGSERVLDLPLAPAPGKDELQSIAADQAALAARLEGNAAAKGQRDIAEAYAGWAETLLASEEVRAAASRPFPVTRLAVGDWTLLALPGEVFVEYAVALAGESSNVWALGYANGNIGYVPTAAADAEGGYEVDVAYKLYGERRLSPACEETILATGRDLLGG